MSPKPRILCVGKPDTEQQRVLSGLANDFDIIHVESANSALAEVAEQSFQSIHMFPDDGHAEFDILRLFQNESILEGMPSGVVLLKPDNTILWANVTLKGWLADKEAVGANFYTAFDHPEITGPDYCPFSTAAATGRPTVSSLRADNGKYYQVHAAPVIKDGATSYLIVVVRDITNEVQQQQKMAAIHRAGIELSDLSPEEVCEMTVDERIELLKSNIVHYTKDLLKFDVVEVRLLDQVTSELVTLISEGIDGAGAGIQLYARPTGNGVTGFVAATGTSYLCEDTTKDPLYLEGCKGAKSSLTVPLILHDQVIGTFNVESPRPRAFSESDLQFLEIFSRDIAMAVNTLELLVAQQANTAQASVDAIHGKVALPVDEILNDAVNVMERYIGHESEVVHRLQRIIRNTRDIKQVIQQVGEEMTPAEAVTEAKDKQNWPRLRGRRILVVDEDEAVRSAAHSLLEKMGCIVETVHDGEDAILMVRNTESVGGYDAIIADIRLPNLNGYELLMRLKDLMYHVPLILMSGFGYDPDHSIVKARQAGLMSNAVLYKPFRRDQLLRIVDSVVEYADSMRQA